MAKPTSGAPESFDRQNARALREAREADRVEPRAQAVRYDAEQGLVVVHLGSGHTFGFPPKCIPGLGNASTKQLATVRISPSRDGLHWDDLDVQASLTGLIVEALNLREWAPRIMGRIRSEAKARAARINGLKGGRPRRSGDPAAGNK